MGALSNDDGDGNENGKKSVGSYYGHRLFFVQRRMRFLILDCSVGLHKKKNKNKKSLEVSE